MHEFFGILPQYGLSDYLTDDIELSDILINPKGLDHFVILPAGNPVRSSSELLGSPKMCSLVDELTSRYPRRIIIFDLPPILDTADAIAFVPCVDSALVVVEDDVTKEGDLKTAIDMLSVTNVIGTVLNKSVY
jgi:Mrp family chromosome partitioning ATPase